MSMLPRFATLAAPAGIRYVGGTTASNGGTTTTWTASLTSLTGGLASSPSAGDLVVVYYGNASTASNSLSATGYTSVSSLYVNAAALDTNLFVGYKFMGATPDSTITLSSTGSTSNTATVAIQVWRGVDPYLPLDVAAATSTLNNSVLANPPAITPVTNGAIVVAGGAGAHGQGIGTYSSSDLTGFLTIGVNGTNDSTIGLGYTVWTSGTFDPAAFTFNWSNFTSYSSAAVTLVLRPNQSITPPAFIAKAEQSDLASSSTLVINKPSGTQQGDLMIAFMRAYGMSPFQDTSWSGDTGWTEILDQGVAQNFRIAYKVAGASEGSSYTFTASNPNMSHGGAILTYRGAAYDTIGSIATGSTNTTATGPSAASNFSRLIGFASGSGAPQTTSTMTQRVLNTTVSNNGFYIADEVVSSGSTGTRTFNSSTQAVLLTIKPA